MIEIVYKSVPFGVYTIYCRFFPRQLLLGELQYGSIGSLNFLGKSIR